MHQKAIKDKMEGFSLSRYDMPYERWIFIFHNPEIKVAWNLLQNKINYIS